MLKRDVAIFPESPLKLWLQEVVSWLELTPKICKNLKLSLHLAQSAD